MEINDIITLEDGKEYLVLDKVSLNNIVYLYTVLVDDHDKPNGEYIYFKEIKNEQDIAVEEVEDEDLLTTLISMFTYHYLNETNEEQEG